MPSTSDKMARTMAGAAHDPAFAKKMGIPVSVAKEFNQADKGTARLSRAMREAPARGKTRRNYSKGGKVC